MALRKRIQSIFLRNFSNTVKTLTNYSSSTANVMNIKDTREYLRKLVGAEYSFSDKKHDRSVMDSYLVDDQSKLTSRSMADSKQTAFIQLSDKVVREKYMNWHGTVRYGQLLENLDTFSVLIAYKHCEELSSPNGESPLSMVTAMVDEVNINRAMQPIDSTCDIIMDGHVTWAGKSSLEIGMWLSQNGKCILDTQFVLVARDPRNTSAAIVPPLEASSAREELLIKRGALNKVRRLEEAKVSLFNTAPTNEEREIVHKMFLNTLDPNSKSFRSRILPEGSVWIESTKLKNAIVCFPEKRNIHNKIFGGYLMRKAYELAWANACVFSEAQPQIYAIDDILFHCPVPVGSLLLMSSQVSCTQGSEFLVRVHAEVMDPRTRKLRTSNVFHFTFTCRNPQLPSVVPKTYGESMLYVDGLRRMKNARTQNFEAPNQHMH